MSRDASGVPHVRDIYLSDPKKYRLKYSVCKKNTKYYEILTIYECIALNSIITGYNILIFDQIEILQLLKFVWMPQPRSSD